MQRCPRCEAVYPDSVRRCALDGTTLEATGSPTPPHREARAAAAAPAAPAVEAEPAAEPVTPAFGELAPGTRVADYEVQEKIGQGGMGTVYRAVHPLIGKRVAIKLLAPALASDPTAVKRFVQEARAVNEIRHRNIVDIFLFGELPDRRQFCVMELLEGESLKAHLRREGRLELDEVLAILVPVADALAAAHEARIVHRDLKPDNVFLVAERNGASTVKLLDFGIAKLLASDVQGPTRTGAPIGTPMYMPPEQCSGASVDHRGDVYSFGVMAYEMVAGRPPFEATTFMQLLTQKLQQDPAPPSSVAPVDAELEALIVRCLARDPAARPQGMPEIHAALVRIGQRSGLFSGSFPLPLPRRRTRSRAWMVGAAGALVVLGGGGLWLGRAFQARAPAAVEEPAAPAPVVTPPPPAPAPAPAPAPVAPTGGRLIVHTNLPRATFTLDGRPVGDGGGRLDVDALGPGPHTVTVTARGHKPRQDTVALEAGRTRELEWTLERLSTAGKRSEPAPAAKSEPAPKKKLDAASLQPKDPFVDER